MSFKPLALAAFAALAAHAQAADLDFSKQPYTAQTAEVNGQTVQYRACENIP